MNDFLSVFSSAVEEHSALKYILPALITALVGIIGLILQFITSIYIQTQQRWVYKTKSMNEFFIPLQKYLNSLNFLYQASGLDCTEIISVLLGYKENKKLSDSIKREIRTIYKNICTLFILGSYSYFNKKIHKEIIRLRNHVYTVNSILKLTRNSGMDDENNIPDIPAIPAIIKEIDKLLKKA
jgi:hypothetical protein